MNINKFSLILFLIICNIALFLLTKSIKAESDILYKELLFSDSSGYYETTTTDSGTSNILYLEPNGEKWQKIMGNYPFGKNAYSGLSTHYNKINDSINLPDLWESIIYTSSTVTSSDCYFIENIRDSTSTQNIEKVIVYATITNGGSFAVANLQVSLRLNGVTTTGPLWKLTANALWYKYSSNALERPGGGDWTWNDINNVELVISSVCTGAACSGLTGIGFLTQAYIGVFYPIDNSNWINQLLDNNTCLLLLGIFTLDLFDFLRKTAS